MQQTSYTLKNNSGNCVEISRKTAESNIWLKLDAREPKKNLIWNTPVKFLNHMLQIIARRACINIEAEFGVVLDSTFAEHVVWEDIGLAVGKAFSTMLEERLEQGVQGAGFGAACIDEAVSKAYISFEGRSGCFINMQESEGARKELVEDAKTQDVRQFFEGFAQGARASVHLEIGKAEDSHHLWESAFRAFGEALRNALNPNKWRKGVIAGVKDVKD